MMIQIVRIIVRTRVEIPKKMRSITFIHYLKNIEILRWLFIIEKYKDIIQEIADVLAKENRLTGAQFDELMKNVKL